jgi:hypothetical protein
MCCSLERLGIPVVKSLIWQYLVVGENSSKDRKRLAPSPSCAIYPSTGVSREERSMAQRYRAGFVAALLISGLAVSSPAMASNIVLNPGFETDALAPWVANPSSNGLPWVTTGPSGDAHTGQFTPQRSVSVRSACRLTQTLTARGCIRTSSRLRARHTISASGTPQTALRTTSSERLRGGVEWCSGARYFELEHRLHL